MEGGGFAAGASGMSAGASQGSGQMLQGIGGMFGGGGQKQQQPVSLWDTLFSLPQMNPGYGQIKSGPQSGPPGGGWDWAAFMRGLGGQNQQQQANPGLINLLRMFMNGMGNPQAQPQGPVSDQWV